MNNGAEDFHVLCVSLIYGFYTDDAGIYIRTSSIMTRFNTTGTGCVLYEMRIHSWSQHGGISDVVRFTWRDGRKTENPRRRVQLRKNRRFTDENDNSSCLSIFMLYMGAAYMEGLWGVGVDWCVWVCRGVMCIEGGAAYARKDGGLST